MMSKRHAGSQEANNAVKNAIKLKITYGMKQGDGVAEEFEDSSTGGVAGDLNERNFDRNLLFQDGKDDDRDENDTDDDVNAGDNEIDDYRNEMKLLQPTSSGRQMKMMANWKPLTLPRCITSYNAAPKMEQARIQFS